MSAGLPQQNGSDTKDRLLDAAEQLFAEHGIDGASMRAITHAAGTSVSAANYHFGSKDELVRAAFSRRVVGLNQQRLAALESLESQPEGPKLEEVVDAFLRPILEAHVEQVAAGPGAQHFQQIAIRIFTDAPARVAELREELFGPLHRRFAAAIRAAVPGCNDVQAERALQLTVALLVHLNNDPQLEAEQDTLLDCMVRYSIAGIRAVVCNDSPAQPLPRMAVTS